MHTCTKYWICKKDWLTTVHRWGWMDAQTWHLIFNNKWLNEWINNAFINSMFSLKLITFCALPFHCNWWNHKPFINKQCCPWQYKYLSWKEHVFIIFKTQFLYWQNERHLTSGNSKVKLVIYLLKHMNLKINRKIRWSWINITNQSLSELLLKSFLSVISDYLMSTSTHTVSLTGNSQSPSFSNVPCFG